MNNCNCGHLECCCEPKKVCHTPDWMMDCGCPTKLSALCVIYQGKKDLDCIGSYRGDRLETILQNIDDRICRIIAKIEEGVLLSNVGDGAEVYKGETEEGINEIRTIKGSSPIVVTESDDTIDISIEDNYFCELPCIKDIEQEINDIETSITPIVKALRTKTFHATGTPVVDLPQTASEVLMVSYCGAVLPPNGYTVNGSTVTLQLSQFGITVDTNDSITVIYNP